MLTNDFATLDAQTAEGHLAQVTTEELPEYAAWLEQASAQVPDPTPETLHATA